MSDPRARDLPICPCYLPIKEGARRVALNAGGSGVEGVLVNCFQKRTGALFTFSGRRQK